MERRFSWTLVMLATTAASVASATCSATKGQASSSQGGDGSGATGPGPGSGGNITVGTGMGGFNPQTSSSGTGGGGPKACDASCQTAGGSCMNNVCTIAENPGMIPPNVQQQLEAGGSGDPSFKWLYPYDATVFPRGLIPPTMQFASSAEAMFVHITFPGMDYKGFYGGSNPVHVKLSDPVWKAITIAAQANDQVKVAVTKIASGQVAGPVNETWSVAQGNLRGTIYYETYGSQLAGEVGIMKIAPGAAQPTVIKTGCGNVCHTASADGSTLVAATGFPFGSAAYDLKNNAAPIITNGDNAFVYGGIYPDGSFVISSTNYRTYLGGGSKVVNTKTGMVVPTPSWDNSVQAAAMPAFSPDGKFVVFNREDTGAGHTLSTMHYDNATKTFSSLQDLTNDGGHYLGWPAYTPDSKWVVYHAGSNNVFETDADATGDLFIVDATSKTTARLDLLNGYQNGGQVYLPANDPNLNFAPTVLPEAVGGFFWVVFTSHRSYGNTLPSKDNGDQNGKLWVAALDLQPTAGKDASHPAFFLEGQENGADNLRGFWVLDPCLGDGQNCTSGDQCCGGYCQQSGDGGAFTCSPVSMGCSMEFDKCSTAADCCDAGNLCINGHCAQAPPK